MQRNYRDGHMSQFHQYNFFNCLCCTRGNPRQLEAGRLTSAVCKRLLCTNCVKSKSLCFCCYKRAQRIRTRAVHFSWLVYLHITCRCTHLLSIFPLCCGDVAAAGRPLAAPAGALLQGPHQGRAVDRGGGARREGEAVRHHRGVRQQSQADTRLDTRYAKP